jgi:hypothetical protein
MLTRNDQPLGFGLNFANESNFNFAIDSIFTNNSNITGGSLPPGNAFLLLDNSVFLLLDGSDLLLL